jgi:hypothetical protein
MGFNIGCITRLHRPFAVAFGGRYVHCVCVAVSACTYLFRIAQPHPPSLVDDLLSPPPPPPLPFLPLSTHVNTTRPAPPGATDSSHPITIVLCAGEAQGLARYDDVGGDELRDDDLKAVDAATKGAVAAPQKSRNHRAEVAAAASMHQAAKTAAGGSEAAAGDALPLLCGLSALF